MANIVNPEAIRFVNEQVRPLCEEARALMARIDALNTLWTSGLNAAFPNDVSPVVDNRDAEGASRLTGANVQSAVGTLLAIKTASNSQIIEKPCVRAISVG
jgi:hypothetical protein